MRLINVAASFVTVIGISLISSSVNARPKPTLQEQLIVSEKRVIWEAVAKKQIDILRSSLADDYLDVSDVGVFDKSETLQLIPDLTLKDYSLDKFKVIKLHKNAAIITYEAIQHWTIKGQDAPSHVRATSAWVKRGGKWLVMFHQESTIP